MRLLLRPRFAARERGADRCAVLVEQRRRPVRISRADRRTGWAGRTAAASVCAPDRHHDPEMAHLRVLDDLVDGVDRCERHVALAQALGPVRERMLGNSPSPAQLLVVLDSRQPRVEARRSRTSRSEPIAAVRPSQNFERGQAYGDQSLVGGSQDVGLREPRPVRRGGRVPRARSTRRTAPPRSESSPRATRPRRAARRPSGCAPAAPPAHRRRHRCR